MYTLHTYTTGTRGRIIPHSYIGCLMLWKKRRMNDNQTSSLYPPYITGKTKYLDVRLTLKTTVLLAMINCTILIKVTDIDKRDPFVHTF